MDHERIGTMEFAAADGLSHESTARHADRRGASKGAGADGASLGMIGRRRRSDGSSASGRSESASRSTAACTAGGTTVAAGEAVIVFSPRLKAQYPVRAKTVVRGRFTRTVTLWNFPSSGCGDS